MNECKTCGTCQHFIGSGDFDLCCDLEKPGTIFGFLCYSSTPACKDYHEIETRTTPYDYFHETMNIK